MGGNGSHPIELGWYEYRPDHGIARRKGPRGDNVVWLCGVERGVMFVVVRNVRI